MPVVNRFNKISIVSALLLLAVFFVFKDVEAAGLSAGNSSLNILAGDSLYYGLTSGTNANGNFLLFERGTGNAVFKIDYLGNITTSGSILGSNTSYWNASGNNVFASSTAYSVGIGLTNPGTKLDVSGSLRNSLATTHSLLGAAGNVVVMADNTGTLYSTSTASFISGNSLDLWKGTKNGNIWNGDAGVGNVGIGVTNPLTRLHVNSGALAASGVTDVLTFQMQYATGNEIPRIKISNAVNTTFASLDFPLSPNTSSGAIAFNTSNNGTLGEVMRINGNGNVGIGTTNPGSPLEVNGAIASKYVGGNSYDVTKGLIVDNAAILQGPVSSITLKTSAATGDANTRNWAIATNQSANGNLEILESVSNSTAPSATKFVINNSGNVGIGTTSPASSLDIQSTNSAQLRFTRTSVAGVYGFEQGASTLGLYDYTNALYRVRVNGANVLLNETSGNVGIGLTNPGTKLDVSGSLRNSLATTHSLLGAAGNVVVMSDNTGTLYSTPLATFASTNSLWGGTKNGNIWNGDAGVGNVGIGATNPLAKLHISQDANTSGAGGDNSQLFITAADNTRRMTIAFNSSSNYGELQARTGAGAYVPININPNGGNVGINTTTPAYKLDVNGTFEATTNSSSIILDASGNISIGI